MEFKCLTCNKEFETRSGFWKHNNNHHKILEPKPIKKNKKNIAIINDKKVYFCRICDRGFDFCNNRWRHEIKCKEKNDILKENKELKEKNKELEKKIKLKLTKFKKELIETKPQVINNFYAPVTNKIAIKIIKPHEENPFELGDDTVMNIFDQEFKCVIGLIEALNFNKDLPQNHNLLNSNLEGRFISTYNPETLTIEKQRKKYFFMELIDRSINKLEALYNKFTSKMSTNKRKNVRENIDKIKHLITFDCKSILTNEYANQINLLSYNYKNMVQETWSKLDNDKIKEIMKEEEKKNLEVFISEESSKLEKDKKTLNFYNNSDDEFFDFKIKKQTEKKIPKKQEIENYSNETKSSENLQLPDIE